MCSFSCFLAASCVLKYVWQNMHFKLPFGCTLWHIFESHFRANFFPHKGHSNFFTASSVCTPSMWVFKLEIEEDFVPQNSHLNSVEMWFWTFIAVQLFDLDWAAEVPTKYYQWLIKMKVSVTHKSINFLYSPLYFYFHFPSCLSHHDEKNWRPRDMRVFIENTLTCVTLWCQWLQCQIISISMVVWLCAWP